MTLADFCKAAERGQPPPVALVHGPDPQSIDDALRAATRGLLRDATAEAFDREVLDGDGVEAEVIVNAAMTLPVVAATRLVAVRRCDDLPARARDVLAAYVARPSPSTCLLLLAANPLTGGQERRPHWLLSVVPPAATITLARRGAEAAERWVRQRAQEEGLAVSPEAVHLLVQLVGDDSRILLGEVRKAALAGGPDNRTVGREEVAAVVGEHRLAGIFDLPKAVVRGQTGAALRILDRLLLSEEPARILFFIARELQATPALVAGRQRSQAIEQTARALGRPAAAMADLRALAESALAGSMAAAARALERCWRTETRLKSGGEPRAELAALVAELCGMAAPADLPARAAPPARGAASPPAPRPGRGVPR